MRDTTTVQLERNTKRRIDARKVHTRQPSDEIVAAALDALDYFEGGQIAIIKDAIALGASYRRNRQHIADALQKAGLPSSWLSSWDAKFERIAAAEAEAKRRERERAQEKKAS